LKTSDICDRFVKPMTSEQNLSLCEVLKLHNDELVAYASVYVVHSWKLMFLDTVDALLHHFCEDPDKVVWLDIFSLNHHKNLMVSEKWFSSLLKPMIGINFFLLLI